MIMEGLEVLKPGLLTTVQDLGRHGYQQFGLSPSGAMDEYALQVANILVGNDRAEAALEMTIMGTSFKMHEDLVVAFTGGDLQPHIDNVPAFMWKSCHVKAGQQISFRQPIDGARLYMSVAGGFALPEVMGSKSTALRIGIGGLDGRELQKGDVLKVNGGKDHVRGKRKLIPSATPHYEKNTTVRVIVGPQEDAFTEESLDTFFSEVYKVTHQSDRMGYGLEGAKLKHKIGADILSDAIAPGSIQVPGDGKPIILMADRQTTGGYTKIANIISVDLPRVAQVPPGGTVSFERVSVEKAQELARKQEKFLTQLAVYCK